MTQEEKKEFFRKKMLEHQIKKQNELDTMFDTLNENQIRFEDCKIGYTYKIDARNFGHAIFYNNMFYGIRLKFHQKFIDGEIHWDKDDRHGTARPQKEIEKTPDEVMDALRWYLDTRTDGGAQKAFEIVRDYLEKFIE